MGFEGRIRSAAVYAGALYLAVFGVTGFLSEARASQNQACERLLVVPATKPKAAFQRSLEVLEQRLEINTAAPRDRRVSTVGSNSAKSSSLLAGFESEYTLKESDRLLLDYVPDPAVFPEVTRDVWLSKSHEQKIAWIKNRLIPRLSSEDLDDGALVPLVLVDSHPLASFLPDQLFLDSTGNLEIILKPAPTLEDWLARVSAINARYGEGSMQSTVGIATHDFFANQADHLGFLLFTNELDTLQKLQAGARKWAKDKTAEVARSFKHPWVGPMTRYKQDSMREMMARNARGDGYDEETRYRVRKSEGSFKYIGGTAYRPDIAAKKAIVLELRDAHQNTDLLKERVYRAAMALLVPSGVFRSAVSLEAFDSEVDYAKLPQEVRIAIQSVVPASPAKRRGLNRGEQLSLQVYRNWGYPLKDWGPALDVLGRRDLESRVKKAVLSYRWKLLSTARRLRVDGVLGIVEADREFQAALAEFAEESGLADAFTEAYESWFLGIDQDFGLRRATPR